LRSSVGARVAYPFNLGSTRVVPEVRASWRHEFLDVQQSINAAFEGNPNTPLNIVGTQTGRDMAVLGMGVTANLSRDTVVYADIDGAFNADKTSATLALGLRRTW
jgi:outer membrane autotransporter protein